MICEPHGFVQRFIDAAILEPHGSLYSCIAFYVNI